MTQAWQEILVVVSSCVECMFFEVVPVPGFAMVLLRQLLPKLGLAV